MKEITHYDAMCPTVVAAGDCPKSFLPSSVPLHVKKIRVLISCQEAIGQRKGDTEYQKIKAYEQETKI